MRPRRPSEHGRRLTARWPASALTAGRQHAGQDERSRKGYIETAGRRHAADAQYPDAGEPLGQGNDQVQRGAEHPQNVRADSQAAQGGANRLRQPARGD